MCVWESLGFLKKEVLLSRRSHDYLLGHWQCRYAVLHHLRYCSGFPRWHISQYLNHPQHSSIVDGRNPAPPGMYKSCKQWDKHG